MVTTGKIVQVAENHASEPACRRVANLTFGRQNLQFYCQILERWKHFVSQVPYGARTYL